jgi:uncharacterized protein YjbJ (UPF0337 family)
MQTPSRRNRRDPGTGMDRIGRSGCFTTTSFNPSRIMKNSTHDRIEGSAKQVRGKAKVAAGKATNSPRLKAKGYADVADGKVQKKIGDLDRARGR